MSIIFPPDVIYWTVTGLSLQTAWSWLMLVPLSLLPPPLTVEAGVPVVITPLSSSPVQAGAGPRARAWCLQGPGVITHVSLLGGSEQTLSQPRRPRSLARPLEVLVLDPEGLGHVFAPERVPALLVILPSHPESLDAAHLPGLGLAATCCASQVKYRRGVRSKVKSGIVFSWWCQMNVKLFMICTDLSVSGVRVPSMSEWAIIASCRADQSQRDIINQKWMQMDLVESISTKL